MLEFYHTLRQTINGVRPMNDKVKYPAISFFLAFIHFTFVCIFFIMNIKTLLYYNVFVTFFYIVIGIIFIKTERYTVLFVAALIEILFHSILATVLLGWSFGFMLYNIALIPVIFYLTYTLSYFKDNVWIPMMISAVVVICYYFMKLIMNVVPHVYNTDDILYMENVCYYYNTALTFIFLYVCSVLFSIEVRYMKRSLEQENYNLGVMANYDPLTHLLNRRSMNVHLKKALENAEEQEFCLIMADIDNFKQVNDTYGHACGDTVLKMISAVISDDVRSDDYVCRWGGEEILILIRANIEVAGSVAQRICEDIANTCITHDDIHLHVTMTLGVAQGSAGDTIRGLIEKADQNLYYGKKHGKNQVVV